MKLMVFDLDGTLADTVHDIARVMNELLASEGLPPQSLEHYIGLVGGGTLNMVTRTLDGRADVPRLHQRFEQRYNIECLRHARLYPGIRQLLARCVAADFRLAVLSNKAQPLVQRFVNVLAGDFHFQLVVGHSDRFPKKPAPDALRYILAETGASEAWMVGDTPIDMAVARAAGIPAVAVGWGYSPLQRLQQSKPAKLFEQVDDMTRWLERDFSLSGVSSADHTSYPMYS